MNNIQVQQNVQYYPIAKLYDPLGLIAPIIIKAKIIMQELWQIKSGWDEALPIDIYTEWQRFTEQLKELNTIKIPRLIIIPEATIIEMHCFSDASEKGYGACIYVKSANKDGETATCLLAAKSNVYRFQD